MTYQCTKQLLAHTGKKYKVGDEITEREWNGLTYREKTEHFIMKFPKKKKETVGIEGDFANEL